jgi:hypothetical protein
MKISKNNFYQIGIFLFTLCIYHISWGQQTIDSAIIKNLQQANETSRQQIQLINKEVATLKLALQRQQQISRDKFLLTSYFIDAAIASANNLQSLVLKESYRNKIVGLNNPTSNEMGFNLETEVHTALKPILEKAKKKNTEKITGVVGSLLQAGGKGMNAIFPAGSVFTSLVSVLSAISTQEKRVDKKDLDDFILRIEKYFNQFERLNQTNIKFNNDVDKLKNKLRIEKEDLRFLIQDLILAMDKSVKRAHLKSLSTEDLMLKYFDQQHIQEILSRTTNTNSPQFPNDAVKSMKEIANDIQRIYDEYANIYASNYKEIKSIISEGKSAGINVDQVKLNTTLKDVEVLYNESRVIDADNLRLKTLFERLETVIQQM